MSHFTYKTKQISGFCHREDENCTLLGFYAASSDNLSKLR